MRLQFERPDGTFGAIEGGTVESMRAAATKVKAAGGRVTWVSDPAILVGQDTFVANASRRSDVRDYDELPIMPSVMDYGKNPMEPVTMLEVEMCMNNASQDGELLPIMPVMNFSKGANPMEHTTPMQAFAAQDIAPARSQPLYVGAQGGGTVQGAANDDELLPIMATMNFDRAAPKTNGKRGRKPVRDDAGRNSEAESMVMPTMQF